MSLDDLDGSRNIRALAHVADGIALWWCDLDSAAADDGRAQASLAPAEHVRAARFGTDTLRVRWIAGRASLRAVLGRVLGIPARDVPIARGARGRPELRGIGTRIDFNVSHTAGVALIGVASMAGRDFRIGVDVESSDRQVGADRLARKFMSERERAALDGLAPDERRRGFLRCWTRKEAMSKATGDGLIAPFRTIDVEFGDAPRLLSGPPPYDPPAWTLVDAPVPEGYFATVAIWDRSAPRRGAPTPVA